MYWGPRWPPASRTADPCDIGDLCNSCKAGAPKDMGKEMGVTWELVGLAMRQVAVKWSTTGEWRVLEWGTQWVRERRAIWGAVGR